MLKRRFCATLLALLFTVPSTFAAELELLSAGSVEPGLRAAVARYEHDSGDNVTISFATAPVLRERAGSAAAAAAAGFDVLVAPLPAEVQNRTTYQASVAAQPRDEAAALRLWRYLSSAEARATFKAAGID